MPELSKPIQDFVLHWGEMGARWGVNRTVAQIHALLMVSERPLPADEIAESLQVARSNVSTSLKELQSWGLVKSQHVLGDRRDHFQSEKDVWDMFLIVMDERKRREIDPTIATLRQCVEDMSDAVPPDAYAKKQIGNLMSFMETTDDWYQNFRKLPKPMMVRFFKLGGRLRRLLGD